MTCPRVRLEEFFDGELGPEDRAATERHLGTCADCRRELEDLARLEGVLRKVPVGAAPDPDRFVQSLHARSRRPLGVRWAAAAALLVVSAGLVTLSLRTRPVDVRAELERYAATPSAQIEERIRSGGPSVVGELERGLEDPDVKVQFAAAALLFKVADGPTRERILSRFQQRKEAGGSWTLSEPGTDDSDEELVPVTVSLALGGQDPYAFEVLRKLNRLSRRAQHRVVDSVVTLLHSTDVEIQRHALEIVKKLEIEFPLSAVVELLDSPQLGDEALRFLRQETQKDLGRNKAEWLRAIGEKK